MTEGVITNVQNKSQYLVASSFDLSSNTIIRNSLKLQETKRIHEYVCMFVCEWNLCPFSCTLLFPLFSNQLNIHYHCM